mgnify:CR=1 FL=1
MADLAFDRDFAPDHGTAVDAAPGVRRVTASNSGPFTFAGTNSYIVGHGRVAVIDPGPADMAHRDALLAATQGETITHILVTHAHHDHIDGVAALREATGATIAGFGPQVPPRPFAEGGPSLDAGADSAFVPDITLADGAVVDGGGWRMEAIATPGHSSDHMVYALAGSGVLFSGDHVMGWSTTVVAPPDGVMADYMRSLDRLMARGEDTYLPGHGGPVRNAHAFVRALRTHRRAREAAILARLVAGDTTIPAIVAAIYPGLDAALVPAAGLSVLAHLEDLVARGTAIADGGSPALTATFRVSSRR